MTSNLFADWLINVNKQMKKNDRKILLFIDNAPCHVINQDLSNIKLIFFPPNTTSKCQPLDQGVIHSFKCHYRQKLVKHIIAQCTLAQTADQISISVLDAIKWIDLSWKNVTEITIQKCFRAAGFPTFSDGALSSTMDTTINPDADVEAVDSDDPLKQLDSLLNHIRIGDSQLTAAEFVDIDSCLSTFNECNDDEHLRDYIQVIQDVNEDEKEEEEEISLAEQPPNLPEALEMLRKLHLYASIEQPQLHNIISDLEAQLTDIYLVSKAVKQTSIKDFFSSC